MRAGDKIRLILISGFALLAYLVVLGVLFLGMGFRMVWLLPVSAALAVITVWASLTYFGVAHLERLAAHRAHGGRHYYFDNQEVRVVIDDVRQIWVRLQDVRGCVGGEKERTKYYESDEVGCFEYSKQRYLSQNGVRRYLRGLRHRDVQRFTLWYQRELIMPMETRKAKGLPLHATGQS